MCRRMPRYHVVLNRLPYNHINVAETCTELFNHSKIFAVNRYKKHQNPNNDKCTSKVAANDIYVYLAAQISYK